MHCSLRCLSTSTCGCVHPTAKGISWLRGLPTYKIHVWWVKPNTYWAPTKSNSCPRWAANFGSDWQWHRLDLLKALRERTEDYPESNVCAKHKMNKHLIQTNAKTLHLRGRDGYLDTSPKPLSMAMGCFAAYYVPVIWNYRCHDLHMVKRGWIAICPLPSFFHHD